MGLHQLTQNDSAKDSARSRGEQGRRYRIRALAFLIVPQLKDPGAAMALLALTVRIKDAGYCEMTQELIARESNQHFNTVARSLAKLERLGLVERVERGWHIRDGKRVRRPFGWKVSENRLRAFHGGDPDFVPAARFNRIPVWSARLHNAGLRGAGHGRGQEARLAAC